MNKEKLFMIDKSLWWIDENGNMWDKKKYSQEKAKELSKTLVNCEMCKDCYDCQNCHSCYCCNDCNNCIDCTGCSKLYDSQGCKYTHDGFECSGCVECKHCKKCKHCEYCDSCFECEEVKRSCMLSYCKRCEDCEKCKNCEDLITCENFLENPQRYSFVISYLKDYVDDEIDSCSCCTFGTGFKRMYNTKYQFTFYFYFDKDNICISSDLSYEVYRVKCKSFEDLISQVNSIFEKKQYITEDGRKQLLKEFNEKVKKAKLYYEFYTKMIIQNF